MDYNSGITTKTKLTNNILDFINKDDSLNQQGIRNKKITYDAIKIETTRLLNREKILFNINTIIAVCLFITIFKTT